MKRPSGMAPQAFDAYIRACFLARINPERVMQTIGDAPASAGVHARDGWALDGLKVVPYCAAVDIRTRDLNADQIKALLVQAAVQGFAGWYRYRGSFEHNKHLHLIFVGLKMKPALQVQVRDFLHDRDGLASHGPERFWTAPKDLDDLLRASFLRANPQ